MKRFYERDSAAQWGSSHILIFLKERSIDGKNTEFEKSNGEGYLLVGKTETDCRDSNSVSGKNSE